MTAPPEIVPTQDDIAEAYLRLSKHYGTHLLTAEYVVAAGRILAGARYVQRDAA